MTSTTLIQKLGSALLIAVAPIVAYAAQPLQLAMGEYPPFFSQALPDNGPLSRLTVQAFATQGISTQLVFVPWARALFLTKGGLTASPGWTPTAARQHDFLFSQPFYVAHDAVFFLKSHPVAIHSMADFKGLKVGIIQGYSYGQTFDDASAHFTVDAANGPMSNLKKLLAKRVDVILMNRTVATAELKTLTPDEQSLIIAGPDLTSKPWCLMVGRSMPNADKIVQTFNAGLNRLKTDGSLNQLIQQLDSRTEP